MSNRYLFNIARCMPWLILNLKCLPTAASTERIPLRTWQVPWRLSYPSNVKVIQVPCTGQVDIIHLLKAIEDGADAVYVAGCMEGECHFLVGNLKAKKRVQYVKKVLQETRH